MTARGPAVRSRIRVTGIVQGVGFRPFVHGLATGLGITGFVGNDESGVVIEAEGPPGAVDALLAALRERPPPLACVTGITAAVVPPRGDTGFGIAASTARGQRAALIGADTATCADCLAEMRAPADRRHRHPFITCTNCGPRFTIITGVPYDRAATTMAGFPMCGACSAEYHDPADRRFHAQPVCCPDCGPTLRFTGGAGDPVRAAADALRAGAVLAVKGLGGYHLAALAGDDAAVTALRARKHREDKPFAVLAAGLDGARELGEVGAAEAAELTSRRAPIVLLRRHGHAPLAAAVAPGNDHVGVILAYTPLHHLLLDQLAAPIVLTSGNVSDEPIAHEDDDAVRRLGGIADAFLTHDRPIRTRADDSVLRVVRGRPYPVRRSRGYAPEPLSLPVAAATPVLGCGAELKNTFCVLRPGPGGTSEAFPSHHIGDLENAETLAAYTDGISHLQRLLDVEPLLLAHDLHPEYLSTKYAVAMAEADPSVELVGVQHHHAHLAACLAENGETGPVIGIACDGLGYGTDGVLWGGEVLDVSLTGFTRLAHLEPAPLPGGTTAIRQPWRMAAAWLRAAGVDADGLAVAARNAGRWQQVQRLLESDVDIPVTTSAGRLFDAVAALIGVRDAVNYEGQAAVELEQRAAAAGEYGAGECTDGYPARIEGELIRVGDLVGAVAADVRRGVAVPLIAARFHEGLADVLAAAAAGAADRAGREAVALSGGVFQNLRLLDGVSARLAAAGLRVLVHSAVPCNDGGISLGQVAVAAALSPPPS